MAEPRRRVDRSLLQIRPLAEGDTELVANFTCGADEDDRDLNEFISKDATALQTLKSISAYLVLHRDEGLVGYIALLTDAVKLTTSERKKLSLPYDGHPVVPALKVARLAVAWPFRETNGGVGEFLVRFAFLTALDISDRVGCRLLTLDAYQKSLSFYEKLGFKKNKDEQYQGKQNVSMRLDVFAKVGPPSWAR